MTSRIGMKRLSAALAGMLVCWTALTAPPPPPRPMDRPQPPRPERAIPTRPLAPPVQVARQLTVVTVNASNAFALGGITWETKMDRLAGMIIASRQVPDIISLTESSGWTWCSTPAQDNSGDYDMVDRLIWRLRDGVGVTYRVAFMVGSEGSFGFGRCRYYTGDTVLYNPASIVNLTPSDVANRPQVAHNDNLLGLLVRRSLPICNRGARTQIPNLEQLIDGPSQFDKCNRATPSAPALAWQVTYPEGGFGVVATLARFGLVAVPNSSFDFITTHPTSGHESPQQAPIDNFIAAMTAPPFRVTRPFYPAIVVGDFNTLINANPPWPTGTMRTFQVQEDVMAVSIGTANGALAPLNALTPVLGIPLPNETPCRPGLGYFADRSFSDHCGLLVRFSE